MGYCWLPCMCILSSPCLPLSSTSITAFQTLPIPYKTPMSPLPQPTMSSNPNSSTCLFRSYAVKLRFLARIRRLLQSKKAVSKSEDEAVISEEAAMSGSDSLQKVVTELLFGRCEQREKAAAKIGIMARDDAICRQTFAELGVVPALVAMVGSDVADRRRLAVQALVHLATSSFTNKALMVEAGLLSNIPQETEILDEHTRHDFAQLLLSISSLANTTQFPLDPSKIIPFITTTLQSNPTQETQKACLSCLYNLSTVIENSTLLSANRTIEALLSSSSSKHTSEKSLAALGNLVVTSPGRKALEDHALVPEIFIEIMAWDDKPKCQELSAYLLMILAHQSSKQREKMSNSGIVPLLLEIALLGSPLAQKRALKLLQWFKDDQQVKVGPHSGPQSRRVSIGSPVSDRETGEGKRMMRRMVKQSLCKNMEVITRRANATGESSRLKALDVSSSSKSLPY